MKRAVSLTVLMSLLGSSLSAESESPGPIAQAITREANRLAAYRDAVAETGFVSDVAHSFGELRACLKVGDVVYISDFQTKKVKGVVVDVSPDSLTVKLHSGSRRFDEREIREIDREQHPVVQILGITTSAGLESGWLLWASAHDCGRCGPSPAPAVLTFGGIGALIGGLVAHAKSKRVVFISPNTTPPAS